MPKSKIGVTKGRTSIAQINCPRDKVQAIAAPAVPMKVRAGVPMSREILVFMLVLISI